MHVCNKCGDEMPTYGQHNNEFGPMGYDVCVNRSCAYFALFQIPKEEMEKFRGR